MRDSRQGVRLAWPEVLVLRSQTLTQLPPSRWVGITVTICDIYYIPGFCLLAKSCVVWGDISSSDIGGIEALESLGS